ncbi:MAG: glycerol kinase GlpK [Eubacteriales bacterium]|nr:glycerol kinase GlpK [Eubacteriales bacterium]
MKAFILGIDQGSTGSKAMIVNAQGEVVCSAYRRIRNFYPQEGWLEHDPNEMWSSVSECIQEIAAQFDLKNVLAIGITNQRETTILWDRASGEALTPAISWQCTRGAKIIEQWAPFSDEILAKTGLISNPYYSASKIAWLFQNDPALRRRAEQGEICFGTVNTWILWKLTGGRAHRTDSSNAGRTMFFDIHTGAWDQSLLKKMDLPEAMLPEVCPCDALFGLAIKPDGAFSEPVPVLASIGDQMSALFGQSCFARGEAKCTIGTCLNLVSYTGKLEEPAAGILPAIANHRAGEITYEIEGGVYVAGSVTEWLIDQLGVAASPEEVDALAREVESTDGVYFVPAFQGLGAPHWNAEARALIIGLSRYHDKRHICRAALESIALQTNDVVETMKQRFGIDLNVLRVDGGVAKSDFVLQLFADLIDCRIERPKNTDRTPMGAVYTAGLKAGLWKDLDEIRSLWKLDRAFEPQISTKQRAAQIQGWKEAISRSLNWVK